MDISNLVYSIITLLLLILVVVSPLLRKGIETKRRAERLSRIKSLKREGSQRGVRRFQGHQDGFSSQSSHSTGISPQQNPTRENAPAPMERIEKLSPLKKAVVWSEILSKPRGLRDYE